MDIDEDIFVHEEVVSEYQHGEPQDPTDVGIDVYNMYSQDQINDYIWKKILYEKPELYEIYMSEVENQRNPILNTDLSEFWSPYYDTMDELIASLSPENQKILRDLNVARKLTVEEKKKNRPPYVPKPTPLEDTSSVLKSWDIPFVEVPEGTFLYHGSFAKFSGKLRHPSGTTNWFSPVERYPRGFIQTLAHNGGCDGPMFVYKYKTKKKIVLINQNTPDVLYKLSELFGTASLWYQNDNYILGGGLCKELSKKNPDERLQSSVLDDKGNPLFPQGWYNSTELDELMLCNPEKFLEYVGVSVYQAQGRLPNGEIKTYIMPPSKNLCKSFVSKPEYNQDSRVDRYKRQINSFIKQGQLDPKVVKKNIEEYTITAVTNALRPILYYCIAFLNHEMYEFGSFYLSGGEAYNVQVDKELRMVTPDIDTKFIPKYRPVGTDENGPLFDVNDWRYMEAELRAKDHLWNNVLDNIIDFLNDKDIYTLIYQNIFLKLSASKDFQLLGIKFTHPSIIDDKDSKLPFRKRNIWFTKDIEKKVLTDIPLFAVDLFLETSADVIKIGEEFIYKIDPKKNDVQCGSILDMPFTTQGQLGYEIKDNYDVFDIEIGFRGTAGDHVTALNVYNDSRYFSDYDRILTEMETLFPIRFTLNGKAGFKILSADRHYADHDTKLLSQLGLREEKKEKDFIRQQRLQMPRKNQIFLTEQTKVLGIVEDVDSVEFESKKRKGGEGASGGMKNVKNRWNDINYINKFNRVVAYIGPQKIINMIAPPTITLPDGTVVQEGVTNCNQNHSDIEVVLRPIPRDNCFNYSKVESGIDFSQMWDAECPNFRHGYHWQYSSHSLSRNIKFQMCVYKDLKQYIESIDLKGSFEDINRALGKMLYRYNFHNDEYNRNINPFYIVQNILIRASHLGCYMETIKEEKKIISNSRSRTKYLNKKRNLIEEFKESSEGDSYDLMDTLEDLENVSGRDLSDLIDKSEEEMEELAGEKEFTFTSISDGKRYIPETYAVFEALWKIRTKFIPDGYFDY